MELQSEQKFVKGYYRLCGKFWTFREAKQNNDAIHLHFEIWVDGEFLGNDMTLPQIRKITTVFFFSE